MEIARSDILTELKELFPKGSEFRQFQIYHPKEWKSYTADSQIKEIKELFPAWQDTDFVLVGATDFGDAIVVTDSDPISPNGAIYMAGEGFCMNEAKDWPESMLRLGMTAKQWHDRVKTYGDEPAIAAGSVDEELGSRAQDYRQQIKLLNPSIDW